MLVVRDHRFWTHVPQGYVTTVQLSDGRVFAVENNSGYSALRGVPEEEDHLFWREWRAYMAYVLGDRPEDSLSMREYVAWVAFLDHPIRRTRARRPEKIEAFEWSLAYMLANGNTPLGTLVEKVIAERLQRLFPATPETVLRRLAREGAAQALRRARYSWQWLFK